MIIIKKRLKINLKIIKKKKKRNYRKILRKYCFLLLFYQ